MADKIRLEVPAALSSLSTVRRVLGGLGARLGCSLDDLDDLYLATDEVLRRAISIGDQESVRVEAQLVDGGLELAIGSFTCAALRAEVSAKVEACDKVDLCRLLNRTMDDVSVRDGGDTFDVVLLRRCPGCQ
jgi:hypothetical protein